MLVMADFAVAGNYSEENYEETPQWIETPRLFVSKTVKAMTGAVDDFLSQDDLLIINESYLKLRMGRVMEEGGHTFLKNDLKLKVDLPKSIPMTFANDMMVSSCNSQHYEFS